MSEKSKKPQNEPAKKPAAAPQPKAAVNPPTGKAPTQGQAHGTQPTRPTTAPTGEQKKPEPRR